MLSSFDGFRFLPAGPRYVTDAMWAHTDQGTQRYDAEFCCVQGSVAIHPSSDSDLDGDFVAWEKSHRAHRGYLFGRFVHDNWFKFPPEYVEKIEQDGWEYLWNDDPLARACDTVPMKRVRICREPGDLVLWYSTTTHMSQAPRPGSQHHASCVFTCYAPRKFADKKTLQRRIKAFEERRTSTHWPVQHFKLFPKTPRIYGADVGEAFLRGMARLNAIRRAPELSALGRRLVGYD